MSAPPSSAAALSARSVSKSFGDRIALDDVGLTAAPGELVAVIGPNGAGKTTLLSVIAGTATADAGEVELGEGEVVLVPQQAALYRRLTVAENLRLFARLEGAAEVEPLVTEMLEQTRLAERRDDQVGTLSGGNQQRVNIAIGLLAKPAILLLDEPSTGLDPRQRARLWDFVATLAAAGTTVVFTTHDIAEAERHADRILVLDEGRARFDGTPAELRAASDSPPGEDFETVFVRFLAGGRS
jgi:ABC-2 type transport system ATP-binding protein